MVIPIMYFKRTILPTQ